MKQQLRSLEHTFHDQLRSEQECRMSESKSFQMARAAHAERLELLKKADNEARDEIVRREATEQEQKIAQLTQRLGQTEDLHRGESKLKDLQIAELTQELEQMEHWHREESRLKDELEKLLTRELQRTAEAKTELETLRNALLAAERRNEKLNCKLEEQALQQRSLDQRYEQSQRELEAAVKKCQEEQQCRRQDADRFEKAREAHQIRLRKSTQEAEEHRGKLERAHKQQLEQLKQELGEGGTESAVASAAVDFQRHSASELQLRSELQASLDTQCLLQAELDRMKAEVEARTPRAQKVVPSWLVEFEEASLSERSGMVGVVPSASSPASMLKQSSMLKSPSKSKQSKEKHQEHGETDAFSPLRDRKPSTAEKTVQTLLRARGQFENAERAVQTPPWVRKRTAELSVQTLREETDEQSVQTPKQQTVEQALQTLPPFTEESGENLVKTGLARGPSSKKAVQTFSQVVVAVPSLAEFLEALNLADAVEKFTAVGVDDVESLAELTKAELREVVNLGAATKIQRALKSREKSMPDPASLGEQTLDAPSISNIEEGHSVADSVNEKAVVMHDKSLQVDTVMHEIMHLIQHPEVAYADLSQPETPDITELSVNFTAALMKGVLSAEAFERLSSQGDLSRTASAMEVEPLERLSPLSPSNSNFVHTTLGGLPTKRPIKHSASSAAAETSPSPERLSPLSPSDSHFVHTTPGSLPTKRPIRHSASSAAAETSPSPPGAKERAASVPPRPSDEALQLRQSGTEKLVQKSSSGDLAPPAPAVEVSEPSPSSVNTARHGAPAASAVAVSELSPSSANTARHGAHQADPQHRHLASPEDSAAELVADADARAASLPSIRLHEEALTVVSKLNAKIAADADASAASLPSMRLDEEALAVVSELNAKLALQEKETAQLKQELAQRKKEEKETSQLKEELAQKSAENARQKAELDQKGAENDRQKAELAQKGADHEKVRGQLAEVQGQLTAEKSKASGSKCCSIQ